LLNENIQFWRFASANNIRNFGFRSWLCFARSCSKVWVKICVWQGKSCMWQKECMSMPSC